MKYLLLIVLFFKIGNFNAQSLFNTSWRVNNEANELFAYFHFGLDTLYYSSDNMLFTRISTYAENSNSITLLDLPGIGICGSTIGYYEFLIENDTLKFPIESDDCFGRRMTFFRFHWLRSISGIEEVDISAIIDIYPNPTTGDVHINLKSNVADLALYNAIGEQVFFEIIPDLSSTFNIKNQGVYYIKFNYNEKPFVKKIVVE